MIFIQLIFILFGLIQTELIRQEFSPLPESVVRTDCHSDDCGIFYVTTNIENIKVGDYVLAQDVETGEVTLKEVTNTFIRTSDHLRYLTTVDEEGDTQTIETTDAHPFWVVTNNPELKRAARDVVIENGTVLEHENLPITEHGYYVESKDLKVGDVFIGASDELTTLTATSRNEFPNGITVYNFSVEDNHNYYVIANYEAYQNGAGVVLVHNADYPGMYLAGKAPPQVTPGTRVLQGQYVDDLGKVQPWEAHYDEFGRLIGRTDYNAGNLSDGIPSTHHHTYEWGPGKTPLETGSHLPGEFRP